MATKPARLRLTAGEVERFTCPAGKSQAFLWDTDAPTMALRATPTGRKTYVFESRLNGSTLRITIGSPSDWPLKDARQRAQELKRMVDIGLDPREVERDKQAAKVLERTEAAKHAVLIQEAWEIYLLEGKPKRRSAWKPRYVSDLKKAASPGGAVKRRGKGLTKPGPLFSLMLLKLGEVNQDAIREWFAVEEKRGPVQAARAMAMFSGFLSWCATRKEYRDLVDRTAARSSELADILPPTNKRKDALELDQLPGWFAGLQRLENRTAATYLLALLLTGARREEMAALLRASVDFRWNKVTTADKVEQTRTFPLTPYLANQLRLLPKIEGNPYMFATTGSASGHITDPRKAHAQVLQEAGIAHLTTHGLRRSFALLGEAAGVPAGAIAQIMGHKPSGVHEGYKPRSIDALRPFMAQVEDFILLKAEIQIDSGAVHPSRSS
ncbi:integrase family protein [Polaromonas sp.]|uniref:integrase family protein n=1 Tax=Polaromonas sp. TaxID=1869339 RepID=UPI002489C49B|nr:integrase family protein [Polaromonas sp.]MDI1339366.1 integrase family protein [Polaromonas sp.]